jgi:ubiquinone/menaquinone biosynthesis C-methylase UbiE
MTEGKPNYGLSTPGAASVRKTDWGVQTAIRSLLRVQWLRVHICRLFYMVLARSAPKSGLLFLNYGYADPPDDRKQPALEPDDEPHRTGIQLYHRVAGAIQLAGLDLLEVSCGHGGGSSYVRRCLGPRSVVGVDWNRDAIRFCRARYAREGLSFLHANALALPFEEASFDAVLNVEASHGYADIPQFFREVYRVLRPNGYFLYADFRFRGDLKRLSHELRHSGLDLIESEIITDGVVRAMDLQSDEWSARIQKFVPGIFQESVRQFAGVRGSRIHRGFCHGGIVYMRYVLRRPALS